MICVIARHNHKYKQGTWFECFDYGCQQVEVSTENNRLKVGKPIGVIIPFEEIHELIKRPRKTGLDRRGIDARDHRETDKIWTPESGNDG